MRYYEVKQLDIYPVQSKSGIFHQISRFLHFRSLHLKVCQQFVVVGCLLLYWWIFNVAMGCTILFYCTSVGLVCIGCY